MNYPMTTETQTGRRWNGRCRKCKTPMSVLGTTMQVGRSVFVVTASGARHRRHSNATLTVACPTCPADAGGYSGDGPVPQWVVCGKVNGVVSRAVPCNAKCTSATGTECMCSCGGRNHGGAHEHGTK